MDSLVSLVTVPVEHRASMASFPQHHSEAAQEIGLHGQSVSTSEVVYRSVFHDVPFVITKRAPLCAADRPDARSHFRTEFPDRPCSQCVGSIRCLCEEAATCQCSCGLVPYGVLCSPICKSVHFPIFGPVGGVVDQPSWFRQYSRDHPGQQDKLGSQIVRLMQCLPERVPYPPGLTCLVVSLGAVPHKSTAGCNAITGRGPQSGAFSKAQPILCHWVTTRGRIQQVPRSKTHRKYPE